MITVPKILTKPHCFVKIGDLHNSFCKADRLLGVIHELCLLWKN